MQKFTIFTIILSTIVITIITELVVSDYLQRLYQNPQSLQASALTSSSFQDFVAPFDAESTNTSETLNLARRLQELASSNATSENSELEDININPDLVRPSSQSIPFDRISSLLPALRIDSLAINPKEFDGRLFQLIDTSALNTVSANYATLDISNEVMGSVYEFTYLTSVDAENAFDEIRILANSFPNIDTNQTNQFGSRSFYINNLVKVGEVFLVIQNNNQVYAFGYKNEFHEIFKTFFGVLF